MLSNEDCMTPKLYSESFSLSQTRGLRHSLLICQIIVILSPSFLKSTPARLVLPDVNRILGHQRVLRVREPLSHLRFLNSPNPLEDSSGSTVDPLVTGPTNQWQLQIIEEFTQRVSNNQSVTRLTDQDRQASSAFSVGSSMTDPRQPSSTAVNIAVSGDDGRSSKESDEGRA